MSNEYARVMAEALRRDAQRGTVLPFIGRTTGWMDPAVHRTPAPQQRPSGPRPEWAPNWGGVSNMVSDEGYLSPADRLKGAMRDRDPAVEELFYDMKMKRQMRADEVREKQMADALARREALNLFMPSGVSALDTVQRRALEKLFSGGK